MQGGEANCFFVLFYPSPQFQPITHSRELPSAPSSALQNISFLVLSSSNLHSCSMSLASFVLFLLPPLFHPLIILWKNL